MASAPIPSDLHASVSFRLYRHPSTLGSPWSGRRVSNPRPSAWKADALPLSSSRNPKQLPRDQGSAARPGCRRGSSGSTTYRLFSPRGMERGGFEPPKAFAGRFTVCSLWPLGHLSTSCGLPESRSPDVARKRSPTAAVGPTPWPPILLMIQGRSPSRGTIRHKH